MIGVDQLKQWVEKEIAKAKLDAQILTLRALAGAISLQIDALTEEREKLDEGSEHAA